MRRLLPTPFGWMRRRPLLSLLLLGLLVAGAAAGAHLYALHEFHEAQAAMEDDHLAEASAHLSFCLTVWPWSAETHFLAARILRMRGKYDDANAQLDECRMLQHGSNEQTNLEALLVRAQAGEVDVVADGLLNQADRNQADERDILEALARGRMQQRQYLPALLQLNRCLAHFPDDARALEWHAWLLQQLAQPDKAAKEYEHLLTLAPNRNEARLRLAELYLDHGDPLMAEPLLTTLEKTDADRPQVQLAQARRLMLQGRDAEAQVLLDKVLADQPDSPAALLYRGKLEMHSDPPRVRAAEAYFRRGLQDSPASTDLHNALSISLRAQPGRQAEADAELQKFNDLAAAARRMQTLLLEEMDKPSHSAEAAYELGKIYLDMGQQEQAVYWLHTAELRDPKHQATHALLADLAQKNGDMDEAMRERTLAGGK